MRGMTSMWKGLLSVLGVLVFAVALTVGTADGVASGLMDTGVADTDPWTPDSGWEPDSGWAPDSGWDSTVGWPDTSEWAGDSGTGPDTGVDDAGTCLASECAGDSGCTCSSVSGAALGGWLLLGLPLVGIRRRS